MDQMAKNNTKNRTEKFVSVFILSILAAVALFCGVLNFKYSLEKNALTRYFAKLEREIKEPAPVTVAVIDSGLDPGRVSASRMAEGGYDYVLGTENMTDSFGHGTMIASLILSNTPKAVKIMPFKVADREGNADIGNVCKAIECAARQGADIINLSLNTAILPGQENVRELEMLIGGLKEQGVRVVVSAGNRGNHVKHFLPACLEDAIVIAAADQDGRLCSYSNYGETVDFYSFGGYGKETGTSYAAAYVTSMLASLQSYGRPDAEDILEEYAFAGAGSKDRKRCGKGYLWVKSFQTVGDNAYLLNSGSGFPIAADPGQYDLGMDILDMNWRKLEEKELKQYLTRTGREYVGMFLDTLSAEEYRELEKKAPILHETLTCGTVRYDELEECYKTTEITEFQFAEYCIREYRNKRNVLSASGEWRFRDDSTHFALTCGYGTAEYVLHDLRDIATSEPIREDISWERLGSGGGGFQAPDIQGFQAYIEGFSTYKVVYGYKRDGIFYPREDLTVIHPEYLEAPMGDNGTALYGISIQFRGCRYDKRGYHLSDEAIQTFLQGSYDPGTGSGETAHVYNHAYDQSGRYVLGLDLAFVKEKKDCLKHDLNWNFNELEKGLTAVIYHVGEDSGTEWSGGLVNRVGKSDGFVNNSEGIMTMNVENMHFPGTVLYDDGWREIAVETDPTEYVLTPVPDTYAVRAYANGGVIANNYPEGGGRSLSAYFPVQYDSNLYDNISGLAPEREGYYFKGWFTAASGGEKVYDKNGMAVRGGDFWSDAGKWKKSYADSQAYQKQAVNQILYAQWERKQYTLRFDGNGSTSGSMPDQVCAYDQVIQLPENRYRRTGYQFDGWSAVRDGAKKYEDRQQGLKNLSTDDNSVITLYACWKDITAPVVRKDGSALTGNASVLYDWTNRNILLKFSAADDGAGMDAVILYDGAGGSGAVVASGTDQISYTVTKEGEFFYTLQAKDKAGNISTVSITTRIDFTTPRGQMTVSYDGYRMEVLLDQIVEQNDAYPGNKASGCKAAWVTLSGMDGDGTVIVSETKPLTLHSGSNIYTGASYIRQFDLSDRFNFDSETIRIDAWVKDIAGNELPAVDSTSVSAFFLQGCVKRCLGDASSWKKGEAGNVFITAGAFVDRVEILYPGSWVEADEEEVPLRRQDLAHRWFDYTGCREYIKEETDLFYIPLNAADGEYHITVQAWKGGRLKSVELLVRSNGNILDEIRTRLR